MWMFTNSVMHYVIDDEVVLQGRLRLLVHYMDTTLVSACKSVELVNLKRARVAL